MYQAVLSVIFNLLYIVVHSVFTLYESVGSVYEKFKDKLLELCHEFVPVNRTRNFQKVTKLPNHLTVLLGTEEPSFTDLANLILWCLTARIQFVTFYDHRGVLKQHEEKFHQLVLDRKVASDHVIWHSRPDFVYKNGILGRKIHVKLLSKDDGRGSIVNVTKKLALAGANFTIQEFSDELKKVFQFPDPDLGLCCGKTFSLFGYPPWESRLTEFFQINTHHNLKFDTFVELLFKFSKCEQRLGK